MTGSWLATVNCTDPLDFIEGICSSGGKVFYFINEGPSGGPEVGISFDKKEDLLDVLEAGGYDAEESGVVFSPR